MELYLDSADRQEIEEAFGFGFLDGLTTTPTFMHRHGIEDIDGYLLEIAEVVPVLQVEALGETSDEIRGEACLAGGDPRVAVACDESVHLPGALDSFLLVWPRKTRVAANSPSLWPTMSSVTKTFRC